MEDLRRRLYRMVIMFIVVFSAGFLSAKTILKKILDILNLDEVTVAVSSPFQFVDVAMDLGFFLAIMVCTPYIIYSLFTFFMPALTKEERSNVLKFVPLSIVLFVLGFSYGFFILYSALGLLASINTGLGVANFWNLSQFLAQIFITSALLGLVFEFPIFLTLLVKINVITYDILKKHKRIAHFLILCLTALFPPTDGLSLIAMALPLVLLYELTILLGVNSEKKYVRIRT